MLNIQQTLKIVSIILCMFALKISTLLCSDNTELVIKKSKTIHKKIKYILNPFVKKPNAIDTDRNKTSIQNIFPELLTNILQFDTEFNTRKLERYITDHTDYLLEPYEPFTAMRYHPLFFTNKAFYELRIKVSKNHHTDGSNPFFFIRYLPFVMAEPPQQSNEEKTNSVSEGANSNNQNIKQNESDYIKNMPTNAHISLNLYIFCIKPSKYKKIYYYIKIYNKFKNRLKSIQSSLLKCANEKNKELIDSVSNLDNFPEKGIELLRKEIFSLLTDEQHTPRNNSTEEELYNALKDNLTKEMLNELAHKLELCTLFFERFNKQNPYLYSVYLKDLSLNNLHTEISKIITRYEFYDMISKHYGPHANYEEINNISLHNFLTYPTLTAPTFFDNLKTIEQTLTEEHHRLMRNILLTLHYFKFKNSLIIKITSPFFDIDLNELNSNDTNVINTILNTLLSSVQYLYLIHDYHKPIQNKGLANFIRHLDPTIIVDYLSYNPTDKTVYRWDGKDILTSELLSKLPLLKNQNSFSCKIYNCKNIATNILDFLKDKKLLDFFYKNRLKKKTEVYFGKVDHLSKADQLIQYALTQKMCINFANNIVINNDFTATIHALECLNFSNINKNTFLNELLHKVTTITFGDTAYEQLNMYPDMFMHLLCLALTKNSIKIPNYFVDTESSPATAIVKNCQFLHEFINALPQNKIDAQRALTFLLPAECTTIIFSNKAVGQLKQSPTILVDLITFALKNNKIIKIPNQLVDIDSSPETAIVRDGWFLHGFLNTIDAQKTFLLPGATTIIFSDEDLDKLKKYPTILADLITFALQDKKIKIKIPNQLVDTESCPETAIVRDSQFFDTLFQKLRTNKTDIQDALTLLLPDVTTISINHNQLSIYLEMLPFFIFALQRNKIQKRYEFFNLSLNVTPIVKSLILKERLFQSIIAKCKPEANAQSKNSDETIQSAINLIYYLEPILIFIIGSLFAWRFLRV